MNEKKRPAPSCKDLIAANRNMSKKKKQLENELVTNVNTAIELDKSKDKLLTEISQVDRELEENHERIILWVGAGDKTLAARAQILKMERDSLSEDITVRKKNELEAAIAEARNGLRKRCNHNFILDYNGWSHEDDGGGNIYRPHRMCVVCGLREILDLCYENEERKYKELREAANRLVKGVSGENKKTPLYDPWKPWEEVIKMFESSVGNPCVHAG